MRTLRVPALCLALSACSALAVPASTTGGSAASPATAASSSAVANDIVGYTNDERARKGLPAFVVSARLMQAAQLHAQQMADHQRMDHTISGARYPTLQSRLDAVGYAYWNAAENVAWNSQSPRSVVTGWMNSSGHRANILNPALTEIGTAVARSAKGEPYWVQVLGTPR